MPEPDGSFRASRSEGPEPGVTQNGSTREPERAESTAKITEQFADVEDTELPRSIGRYRVISLLGRGGTDVLLGHDDELDRPVAIKIPLRERVKTPDDVNAFLEEARLVASLDHKGIVPVYDVGRTPTDCALSFPSSSEDAVSLSGSSSVPFPA